MPDTFCYGINKHVLCIPVPVPLLDMETVKERIAQSINMLLEGVGSCLSKKEAVNYEQLSNRLSPTIQRLRLNEEIRRYE
jgi:hypothetical protein